MNSLEPKKLALLRILEILKKHSDFNHPLTQEEISEYLVNDYGIDIERKAIGRNIALLKEAGYDISSNRSGSFLDGREIEDSELRMLIDGVLCSRYITASHSKALIEKLCGLSNEYFRSHIKNVFSVNDWSKTDNQALFYNIEIVDEAIERGKQISFDYNKYGIDKKLHKTSTHKASPYQLILHNQKYYLMALSNKYDNVGYFRLDHITNMKLIERDAIVPITKLEGFERGIDYKEIATTLPYMYSDKAERIEMIVDDYAIDPIFDWFGKDATMARLDKNKIRVSLRSSVNAMEHWAMQYIDHVEILKPAILRERICKKLEMATKKYNS